MSSLASLAPAELLAAAEANVRQRRRAEVERLELALAWCDQHGDDPQERPGAIPARHGGDRLIDLGGQGTPRVQELCWGEWAVGEQTGVVAVRHLAADALDLRHRLPALFEAVRHGACEVWLARKVASMSRRLNADDVALVDAAVSVALGESPSRVLAIAEAKVIEADPEAHRERVAADNARTGVWLGRNRVGDAIDPVAGEPATRRIAAKVPLGVADEVDAVLDALADALAAHGDHRATGEVPSRDQLRVQALALLAQPHAAMTLLDELDQLDAADTDDETVPARRPRRRSAVVHVHLSVGALTALGVARVEDLGPLLVEQLAELLGRCDIQLLPVLDLNAVTAVHGYEHPTEVRERVLQRVGGDAFPHASARSRRLDHDHVVAYRPPDDGGPPGQTSDLNAAPLGRTHHRMKTHLGYQVHQLGLGAYRWLTPHGLCRVVTPIGTARVEPLRRRDGTVIGEWYAALGTEEDVSHVPVEGTSVR